MEGFSMNYSNNSSNSNVSGSASSNCSGTKYVIKKGDTLYSISRRYNVPLALVLRANPYVDVYNLQIGDEICIPSEQESSAPARPPVVTGPGPVRMPEYNNRVSDDLTQAEPPVPVVTAPGSSSSTATGSNSGSQSSKMTAPVTIPARNDNQPFRSQTAPSSTASATPNQNVRTEMGSRNTFNFNYYGGEESSKSETEEPVRRQNPTMTPSRSKSTSRQTIPLRRPAPTTSSSTQNQSQMMRQGEQQAPVRRSTPVQQQAPARQVTPVQQQAPAGQATPVQQQAPVRRSTPVQQQAPVRQVTPMQQSAPARTNSQARQTIPVRRPQNVTQPMMPYKESVMPEFQPVQEAKPQRVIVSPPQTPSMPMQPNMVTRTRMVAPVRLISQPEAEMNEKESCNRWNAYQDRERFNSIMYDSDTMMKGACKKSCPSQCTQNVLKPNDCYNPCGSVCGSPDQSAGCDDEVTLISYVSRDNDTLQDILDYFTMDIDDLFVYTIPNDIKLRPGCRIQVPGKGDDR